MNKTATTDLKAAIEREIKNSSYNRTYRVEKHISLASIRRLFNSGYPTRLLLSSLKEDLSHLRDVDPETDVNRIKIEELESFVLNNAPKLYTLLLLVNHSPKIVQLYLSDPLLTDRVFKKRSSNDTDYCSLEFLQESLHLKDIAHDIFQKQWLVPPILRHDITQSFPGNEFQFPFEAQPDKIDGGTGGAVFRAKVAGGHLEAKEYVPVSFTEESITTILILSHQGSTVAYKAVDVNGDKETLLREVELIRTRRHPNIIAFYASFIAKREDPWHLEDNAECLHMLFEHADGGNLHGWLYQPTTPPGFGEKSTRGEKIMQCIQDLVDAITCIHSEIDGHFGYHHDIKPKNIVLFKGPPLVWKICDFGMANIKHFTDGSGTGRGRYDEMGTHEYQPPEYDDNMHQKHGRAFDVYSLGCVLLELATVWKYGWESRRLAEFRTLRNENTNRLHQKDKDYSFHNNPLIVQDWSRQLRAGEDTNKCFLGLLDLIQEMMEPKDRRIFIWEVNMDLYDLTGTRTIEQLKQHLRKVVQPSRKSLNALDNNHNPLQRAISKGKDWQVSILEGQKWSVMDPPVIENTLTERVEYYSTLDTSPQNNDFASHGLLGRHDTDRRITEAFNKCKCVGIYGVSGMGKSHLAYHYVNRFRKTESISSRKHTFWIEAGTEARLRETVRRLADQVGLVIDELEDPLVMVRKWLSEPLNGTWIMVLDGVKSFGIARIISKFIPENNGSCLVTTTCRSILEELDIKHEAACIEVGDLSMSECRSLFGLYNEDIPPNSLQMDKLLRQLNLPILLKVVAVYLRKHRITTATWYNSMKNENRFTTVDKVVKDSAQHHRILLPLISQHPPFTQFRRFPSPELKLLAELSCLNKDEIDIKLIKQNYKDEAKLFVMLGRLENYGLISQRKGSRSSCYFMHDRIQSLVRLWIIDCMGKRTLLELHETALCMLLCQYKADREADKKKHMPKDRRSSYLLKLPLMPHFEQFLRFAKRYEQEKEFPFQGYDCSDRMVQSVITFFQVYLDEGCYEDAAFIMDFTRKLYRHGVKFQPHLARHFSKAHVLPPLTKLHEGGRNEAVHYLEEVIRSCTRGGDDVQRWFCVLELAHLFCRSSRPKDASSALASLPKIRIEIVKGEVILKTPGERIRTNRETETKLVILRRIAEATIQFTSAKLSDEASRKKLLRNAQLAFEDANLAIRTGFPSDEKWSSEVQESIADVLCRTEEDHAVLKGLQIYENISKTPINDLSENQRADDQKRKWDIDCKIACVKMRMDDNARGLAVDILEKLLQRYEKRYGFRDGKHDEHMRSCACLLQQAYRKSGNMHKAEDIKDRYGPVPNEWVQCPKIIIEGSVRKKLVRSAVVAIFGFLISISMFRWIH